MTMMPRSLSGRLFAISALTTIAALLFAAFSIGHVLERFVIRGLDEQLDAQLAMLARAVRPDGTLDQARVVDLPMFDRPGQGWGWRVESPAGTWQGGDAFGTPVRVPRPPPRRAPPRWEKRPGPDGGHASPGEGISQAGEPVHMRALTVPTTGGLASIAASGPRRLALAPLREAMPPLLGSLAILGFALSGAILLQLRFGLRPVRTLQAALADVRAGRSRHVPAGQPDELAPLAAELNALIDQNEAQLGHARRHVANLAHGLKTPLAALSLRLAEGGHDPDGTLGRMVADIDKRVRHHLGRARAATPGGRYGTHTVLAAVVGDLVTVMRGIHADRPIGVSIEVAPDLAVAVDAQDVSEMLGNLLDNAWRHAGSFIAVTAVAAGSTITLSVEDDGSGLSEQEIEEALVPGRRLDERGDGHGFGLPIAQELAELHGGALALGKSTVRSGLRVDLALPASRHDPSV